MLHPPIERKVLGESSAALHAPTAELRHRAFLQIKCFGSLDGVRCFSILAVIWHHVPRPRFGMLLTERGFLGVDMFFVLSGFLIVTLLLRERNRTGSINLKSFYIRRTLRIFPIYYLLILTLALLMLVVKPGTDMAREYWHGLPYLLTYTLNWVPLDIVNLSIIWSLATEEQFYLIWPGVECYLKPAAVLVVLVVVIAVNQAINFGVLNPLFVHLYGTNPKLEILNTTFTPIALGVLLAHALHRPVPFAVLHRLVGTYYWSPVVLVAALLLLCEFSPADIQGLPRLSIQVVMALWLASLVVREDHAARPLLAARPIARLGAISYGMYLYHMWAMHIVREGFEALRFEHILAFFAATVAATVVIAELSYRFIESPLLKLKHKYNIIK